MATKISHEVKDPPHPQFSPKFCQFFCVASLMLFMFACFVAYLCILVIVLVFICMISCVCMRAGQSAGVEEHMLVSRRPHHCGLILLLALGTTLDNDDCHYGDDYFGDGGDAT